MAAARTRSLRSHLVTFGFLIIVPMLLVGTLLAILYIKTNQTALRDAAHQIVRQASNSIDRELQRYAAVLAVLANSAALNEGNFQKPYSLSLAVTEAIPRSYLILSTVEGKIIFSTLQPLGAEAAQASHTSLRAAEQTTIKKRQLVVSNLWTGNKGHWIGLIQPVTSDGGIRYLLTLAIEARTISEIIGSEQRSKKWLIGVVGTDNVIISRTWEPEQFVGHKAAQGYIKGAQGDAGAFYNTRTLEGTSVFNTYVRSNLTGWTVVAAITVAELQAPLRDSALVLFGLLAGGTAVSLLLSYFYGRLLLRPAAKLLELSATPLLPHESQPNTGIREFNEVAERLSSSLGTIRKWDEERAMLIGELNHRGRNMLTAIQSIAHQSVRRAGSLKEFESSFDARLRALASSYGLLNKSDWRNVDLKLLVLECCGPFAQEERVRFAGPAVRLHANAVVGMAMVIHELCTNATKYGALNEPAGWISVKWFVQMSGGTEALKFEWKEHGVSHPNDFLEKRGFGSHLITTIVEREFRSKLVWRFDEGGIYFGISIPLDLANIGKTAAEPTQIVHS